MDPTIDDLEEAIREIDTLEYQLQTGNCGKFAIALQNLAGGNLIGVFSEPGNYYDHVLLEWKDWWWDGDGLQDPEAYVVPALQIEVAKLEGNEQDYIEVSDRERALDRTSPSEIRIGYFEFLIAENLDEVTNLEDYQKYQISRVKLNDDIYRYRFSGSEEEIFILAENKKEAIEKISQ